MRDLIRRIKKLRLIVRFPWRPRSKQNRVWGKLTKAFKNLNHDSRKSNDI